MDDKLAGIQNLLAEICAIRDSSPSSFIQSLEVQTIAEDVFHKLELMRRKMLVHSNSSPRPLRSGSISSVFDRSFLFPDASRKSSETSSSRFSVNNSITSDIFDKFGSEQAAKDAYDKNCYAQCIRIVEKIFHKEREISRELFHLCHDSYKKNVEQGYDETETLKFCEWWKSFLDVVKVTKAPFDDDLELTDCRTECLWERQRLCPSENERLEIMDEIMRQQLDAYDDTAFHFRRFHPKCLRRIKKICSFVESFYEEFTIQQNAPRCIEDSLEIARIGVNEAKNDAKDYARETGISGEQTDDICYIESLELIKDIDEVLSKYLDSELFHSDTESDCFGSSEEGQDIEMLKDDSNTIGEFSETTTLTDKMMEEDANSDENENCITHL